MILGIIGKLFGCAIIGPVIGMVCLGDLIFQRNELQNFYKKRKDVKWKRPKRRPM